MKHIEDVALSSTKQMEEVVRLEKDVKAKEREILDASEKILELQKATNVKMEHVLNLEIEVKKKERSILEAAEKILALQQASNEKINAIYDYQQMSAQAKGAAKE